MVISLGPFLFFFFFERLPTCDSAYEWKQCACLKVIMCISPQHKTWADPLTHMWQNSKWTRPPGLLLLKEGPTDKVPLQRYACTAGTHPQKSLSQRAHWVCCRSQVTGKEGRFITHSLEYSRKMLICTRNTTSHIVIDVFMVLHRRPHFVCNFILKPHLMKKKKCFKL